MENTAIFQLYKIQIKKYNKRITKIKIKIMKKL